MKNFKNSRFKIEISTFGGKKPYLCYDKKYNHIVHRFEFKEDAREWCKMQNKNCTFGRFEFPRFLRPYDE